ncbi:cupin domain-containing protein [Kineococcus radiotolerans]|uniref:Cupin 2 conserved barrel domain protein n=1 Tax=Kineococcus radiotolerans (strain ATCC BAA-149 / DSM 14245 / SRS30216) TaxID=266940 RepID=A6WFT2_KINRD|nr:cupin domain-containing protein [Kineococcus radiotolerans]ABS05671.1 Cupin 2 conserved barrel domain protein [Kineococcus radiotolerans SRS30216 = ATCC BAA-149]
MGTGRARPAQEFAEPAGPWVPAPAPARGVWNRVLGGEGDDAALLQRYEPGGTSGTEVLRHEHWEEVYVLSGALTDLTSGVVATAGTYAFRPPGMPHGPYRSEGGWEALVTTCPAAATTRPAAAD